jgi:hypothetical protein
MHEYEQLGMTCIVHSCIASTTGPSIPLFCVIAIGGLFFSPRKKGIPLLNKGVTIRVYSKIDFYKSVANQHPFRYKFYYFKLYFCLFSMPCNNALSLCITIWQVNLRLADPPHVLLGSILPAGTTLPPGLFQSFAFPDCSLRIHWYANLIFFT